MTLNNLIRGLTILQDCNITDSHSAYAEHDVIYVSPTDTPVHISKLKELISLGWSQEHWDGEAVDWILQYAPSEPWMAYL